MDETVVLNNAKRINKSFVVSERFSIMEKTAFSIPKATLENQTFNLRNHTWVDNQKEKDFIFVPFDDLLLSKSR